MSYRTGVYFWGMMLIIWLSAAVAALALPDWQWAERLKQHDSLAAAITAVLGVLWSWFLKLNNDAHQAGAAPTSQQS